ncbi:MAG: CRISPR-associated endonuclease Cas2 [Campylobacteraceae bacterium]|jgi:CRISPR-associated protein Cas2|nr:CRISPR-associated endonuclease Cas2 [Campylobacteraceae bacterium]
MPKFVIAYDIPDTKRRTKIHDILFSHGVRVNDSVFEIDLSMTDIKKLKAKLFNYIDISIDSVRWYAICQNCLAKSETMGTKEHFLFTPKDTFIT